MVDEQTNKTESVEKAIEPIIETVTPLNSLEDEFQNKFLPGDLNCSSSAPLPIVAIASSDPSDPIIVTIPPPYQRDDQFQNQFVLDYQSLTYRT